MPIYEYECSSCGRVEEVIQRFSDAPLTECDKCHGKLNKLISQSSFHLKGSGWYVTDYAGKSKNSAQSSSTSDASPATGESSSESTPSKTKTPDSSE